MAMDSVALTQQSKPGGSGREITPLVIEDLEQRSKMGAEKYGTVLKAHNGRNALVDAYQEAIDLTVYLRQKIEEDQNKNNTQNITSGNDDPIGVEIKLTSEIDVELIQSVGGDYMVAAAAKVSTSGEQAKFLAHENESEHVAGLINYLMKMKHGSAFEHSSMTFFVHAPIFVFREWHRHRLMSYNEESARYKQLDPLFWIPRENRKMIPSKDHKSARPDFVPIESAKDYDFTVSLLATSYEKSYEVYDMLLRLNIAKEVARACLPVAIYSSCWVTCNPRSLMAFLSLRTHDKEAKFVSYPQAEIEEAARACEKILEEGWPLTYKAFVANGRVAP